MYPQRERERDATDSYALRRRAMPMQNHCRCKGGRSLKRLVITLRAKPPRSGAAAQVTYDAYILGPGDGLQIELLDLPELSGRFSIGPDGTLYLPRLRALYVEGLTVEELRYVLTQQFSTDVRDPQVYVRPVV